MASVGKADLVILFVKTYHTEKAVSDALVLEKEDTVFLTLQNGLGNEEVICRQVNPKKILLGVTNQGATLLGPGKIRHAGWGKTFIGELDRTEDGSCRRDCSECFRGQGLKPRFPPHPVPDLGKTSDQYRNQCAGSRDGSEERTTSRSSRDLDC